MCVPEVFLWIFRGTGLNMGAIAANLTLRCVDLRVLQSFKLLTILIGLHHEC